MHVREWKMGEGSADKVVAGGGRGVQRVNGTAQKSVCRRLNITQVKQNCKATQKFILKCP